MRSLSIVKQSIEMVLSNIKSNKMRSFLTMLGIVKILPPGYRAFEQRELWPRTGAFGCDHSAAQRKGICRMQGGKEYVLRGAAGFVECEISGITAGMG